jgi:hypothetical protein
MKFDRPSQHADELHFQIENLELLPGNFEVYLLYRYKSTNTDANAPARVPACEDLFSYETTISLEVYTCITRI